MAGGHAPCGQIATPVGLWQAVDDDTKQPTGWFLISDHDGVYDGIIAKMFLKPGEDPNALCDQCKDDRHDHPWLGLEIIRGMKPDGDNKYAGGTILDPRDGKVYKAMMTVTPDGQTLIVRGYIGFSLLGRNRILDALAGFRLQHARSVRQSQPRRQSGRNPKPIRANHCAAKPENSRPEIDFADRSAPTARPVTRLRSLLARLAHQDGLEQRRRRHRRHAARSPTACPCWMSRDGWKTTGCRRRSPSSAR